LAYAAAVARRTLGEMPDRVVVGVSGSIIKNVKSVIVPNTGHLKGIPAAVTAGIVAGKPEKELEVIGAVTQEQIMQMKEFMEGTEVRIEHIKSGFTFDIIVTLYKDSSYSKVRIANFHTNIVLIEKDGNILGHCRGRALGIAYLCGGGYKEVIHTMVNALAIISGIVCDGAKASCAAKIASSIDAGIFGYSMYMQGQQFLDGDGIVTKGVEATLKNVGRLGKEGMKETNEEIIKIMIGE
jgi:L-cysteine desulfidase